ncbi:TPA: glutathione-regulated potassium-efflux system ancillary protein KefG, partial [Vibrio cholerae]|nr:glutathione-regulated potassium-efflux system ancillary protein KefG [Vibrio cholerae]
RQWLQEIAHWQGEPYDATDQ